ncbi:MAG: hypothetical protein IPJ41_00695 [Phycisphaerales bacterium]|nr:hypothetical protein [Phycisphaerales bacterium]
MRVARFWAYGQVSVETPDGGDEHRALWRGSDLSPAAAEAELDRALGELARRLRTGEAMRDWYRYADLTRPEPLVEDIIGADGTRTAAVTINRYGATILNTARVPFVDVDFPRPRAFARWFGRKAGPPDPSDELIKKLRAWVGEDRGRSGRVYRTAAGLRYLLPATEIDPSGDEAAGLLRRFGADKCYANLCRAQRCYRARLSPKPWRMGLGRPPGRISYGSDPGPIEPWSRHYEQESARFAVCRLVETLGDAPPTPDAARVLELHDAATGVGSTRPLA